MSIFAFLKARRATSGHARRPVHRLLIEYLEDRLVPSIPDGTLLVCTGPSSFSSQDQSSYSIGILGVDPSTGVQFPISVDSSQNGNLFTLPTYVIEGPDGQLYVTDLEAFGTGAVIRVDPDTGQQVLIATGGAINGPNALAWVNGALYVANEADSSGTVHSIVQVDPNTGAQVLITDGNNGPGFTVPTGMVPGPGNSVYVADEPGNYSGTEPGGVWEVNLSTGQQTLITWGNLIDHPQDLSLDQDGNLLVLAATSPSIPNGQVIRVNPATPDPTGMNQSVVYAENDLYPLDSLTEDLETGTIYSGSISYGTNPAVLFAINPVTQTQTTVTSAGDLSLVESILVYHAMVQGAATRPPVASSMKPSVIGQMVTVSAQAAGSSTITGTVQFQIDSGTAVSPVATTTSNDPTTASLSTSTLLASSPGITAIYADDSQLARGSGSLTGDQVVQVARAAPGSDTFKADPVAALFGLPDGETSGNTNDDNASGNNGYSGFGS